ncbi:hypothetical protein ACTQ08_08210, partial [Lactobacillus amylovorus]
PSNFHFKNKKHRNSLKIMNCCVFISGLKIEFFPRHFLFLLIFLYFFILLLQFLADRYSYKPLRRRLYRLKRRRCRHYADKLTDQSASHHP